MGNNVPKKPKKPVDSLEVIRVEGQQLLDTLNYIEELYLQLVGMGFTWSEVFLPEGTVVRLVHEKKYYYAIADVKGLWAHGELYSPENFVLNVCGPSRDPLRALWIKKPEATDWELAYDMKHGATVRRMPSRRRPR